MNSIISWAKKNQATAVALIAVVLMVGFVAACKPKTTSIIDPTQQVTRQQLEAEVVLVNQELAAEEADIRADLEEAKAEFDRRIAGLNATREAKQALKDQADTDLAQKEQAIADAVGLVEGLIATAAGPYAPLAVTSLGILVAGLGIDNRRKDGVIKGQKMKPANSSATPA